MRPPKAAQLGIVAANAESAKPASQTSWRNPEPGFGEPAAEFLGARSGGAAICEQSSLA